MAENSFEIVSSNADFIVINKMPDVNFHTEAEVLGVFESVKQSLGLTELYPVHRLDKVTSGLLIMAKHADANRLLCEKFASHSIQKFYLAISGKKPSKKQGAIIGDMQSARRGAFKLMQTRHNPAITQFFSAALGAGRRAFLLKPLTGKTHQLRVALKSLGSAILGDPLYSDGNLASDRTYLHAWQLHFEWHGEPMSFRADPAVGEWFCDAAFTAQLDTWQSPQRLAWPNVTSGHHESRAARDHE